MTNIDRAIARLRDAWENAGRVPAYHHRVKAELHGTWPTLANAITDLLAAVNYPKESPMPPELHKEWRTIDPYSHERVARHYGNRAEARDDTDRFPHRVVQHRLVSDWEDDR